MAESSPGRAIVADAADAAATAAAAAKAAWRRRRRQRAASSGLIGLPLLRCVCRLHHGCKLQTIWRHMCQMLQH